MRSLTFFVPSTRRHRKTGRPLPLPGRNELENDARSNRYAAGAAKREETERVAAICRAAMAEQGWSAPPEGVRVEVSLVWSEVHGRESHSARDQDNITAYQKPLLDGLVMAGAIADDDQRHIAGCSRNYLRVDKENPGVLVELAEISDEGM